MPHPPTRQSVVGGARTLGRHRSIRTTALAVLILLGSGLAACSSPLTMGPRPNATTTSMPSGTSIPSTTAPRTTTTTAPHTTTTTTPTPPLLEVGSSGPAVLALQEKLTALGYWLGTPDGTFGDSTEQAVYALQKAAGIGRDGVVGPITSAALAARVVPHPRSTAGYVIEVDLEDDLVMFVRNGTLLDVLNTSTGGGYTYTDAGVTAVAETPRGRFSIYREVDGMVVDSLGQLWRPKFFDDGFAIHGDSYVPPEPVSHGCVRVSNEAIDWIWSDDLAPVGTTVWVY